jgi:hypothetical protein
MTQFERGMTPSESHIRTAIEIIREIEGNLKADDVLSVYCEATGGSIHVKRFQFKEGTILVHGFDESNNQACLISSGEALQLTCKVTKGKSDVKKVPIGFNPL